MVSTILIISIIVATIAAALGGAYIAGALDEAIEKLAMYLFKAKAKAEKKKLQAQGLKEGRDFVESGLKGNKQANEVIEGGLGNVGGDIGEMGAKLNL